MPLTPDEIIGKKFTIRFRGYDRKEVTAFLEEVANLLALLVRERNLLKDKLIAYKRQIALLKKQESEFRNALAVAHRTAEDMRAQAEKDAEVIIERAKLDADRIVADAHKEALALEERIRRLRMMQREAVHKMRSSFEGFLRVLDDEMVLPPEEFDETLRITAEEIRSIQEDIPDDAIHSSKENQAVSEKQEKTPSAENRKDTEEKRSEKKDLDFEPEKLKPSSWINY